MEIRNFITFKEIVDTGSFTEAAKKLHYAQSTVTSHIQAIEESMGLLLFDRIGKKIILTETGKKVYKNVLKLLATYEDIKNISNDEKEISGEIKVKIPDSLMLYKLSPIIKEYQEKYSKVKIIHLGISEGLVEKVIRGELDIAIGIGIVPKYPELICKTFGEVKFSLVYSSATKNLDKESYYTLLYTEKNCSFRQIFNDYIDENQIKSTNQIETGNIQIIKEYITNGLGISVLPNYVFEKEKKRGELNSVPVKPKKPHEIYMIYHKDKSISPAMKKFIELINEKFLG